MIRRFCDACDQEIKTSYVDEPLRGEHTFRPPSRAPSVVRVKVEIRACIASQPADRQGDVCRDCVIDAVMTLDQRPQYMPASGEPAEGQS